MDMDDGTEKNSFLCNELQCSNLHDSEEYSTLEQAAATVWTVVEDGLDSAALIFAECENSHDFVNHLKSVRRSYASSLKLLRNFQAFTAMMVDRVKQFEKKLEEFENQITCTAMSYGLNLLPDEVLAEIFVLTATTLEEKVALSLVCKRFRRVMMSMRRMWDGYRIDSNQSREQMIAIAEGNRFVSLKARLHARSPVAFVKWILSLEPEELECPFFDESSWETFGPILAGWSAQNLRSLVIHSRCPNMRILEKWNFPHLESLEADFVPGTALGRNLVRCRLDQIRDNEVGSLRNFLANANSLQDLHVTSCSITFYEMCDLPSLRSLGINFVPHPSLAKHLVCLRLSCPMGMNYFRLPELLDFLSISTALQELDLVIDGIFDIDDALPAVTMPSIVSCAILDRRVFSAILIAKLRMPNLRTLKLEPVYIPTQYLEEFQTSLHSMKSLEELELKAGTVLADLLDEIIRFAPHHLESFTLKDCYELGSFVVSSTSPVPLRRLIRFTNGHFHLDNAFIPDIVDYLRSVGLDKVKIEFCNCTWWRNGTYGLDEVLSAKQY